MKRYERLQFRVLMIIAALRSAARDLRLGLTIPGPIAGGSGEGEGGEGGDGGEGSGGEGGEGSEGKGDEGGEQKPPWKSDKDFNPEKAWNLIKNLRGENSKVKGERDEAAKKVKDREDADKTEEQRLKDGKDEAEKSAKGATAEAARLRVALRKGLTETQAKRLVGETEEELEKDAEELLESFKAEGDDDEGQGSRHRRPKEKLRPGAAPSAEADTNDPGELAKKVPRRW